MPFQRVTLSAAGDVTLRKSAAETAVRIVVTPSPSMSGVAYEVEASLDGVRFSPIGAIDESAAASVPGSFTGQSAGRTLFVGATGFVAVRVRVTAVGSGAVHVSMVSANAPSPVLVNRRNTRTPAPTAWLDPALRVFSDTGGTTPAVADGVVRCWTNSSGEKLTISGTNVSYRTLGGKPYVRSDDGSGVLRGSVVTASRPAVYDLLQAVTDPQQVGFWSTGLAGLDTEASGALDYGYLMFFGKTLNNESGLFQCFYEEMALWSAVAGANEFLSDGSPYSVGGVAVGWNWWRLTVTPGSVRTRVYSGPGVLLSDRTKSAVHADSVFETGVGGTTSFSVGLAGCGRTYRRVGASGYSDAEIAAIFADSAYP